LLRDARRACELSQAELAKVVNVSPIFVSQIENGQRLPSDRVAKDIAIALDLPWADVLRRLYGLRSPQADELFAVHDNGQGLKHSLTDLPAVRSLLLQLAGLNLSGKDIEKLVRNWTNDVSLIRNLKRAHVR
jgi:transcriptional regulator with XRE-family HTH domain